MAHLAFLMPLLLQGATAAPADAAAQPQPVQVAAAEKTPALKRDEDKVICRRQQKTGSLAGFTRVCHTKAQWQRTANDTKHNFRQIQGHKGSAWDVPAGGP